MRQSRAASLIGVAVAVAAAGYFVARARSRKASSAPARDYSDRSGFPRGAALARGLAADVARDSLKWLSRPGNEVLPTSRVRAMTQPAAPAG
jgi:hypothetical protein